MIAPSITRLDIFLFDELGSTIESLDDATMPTTNENEDNAIQGEFENYDAECGLFTQQSAYRQVVLFTTIKYIIS